MARFRGSWTGFRCQNCFSLFSISLYPSFRPARDKVACKLGTYILITFQPGKECHSFCQLRAKVLGKDSHWPGSDHLMMTQTNPWGQRLKGIWLAHLNSHAQPCSQDVGSITRRRGVVEKTMSQGNRILWVKRLPKFAVTIFLENT